MGCELVVVFTAVGSCGGLRWGVMSANTTGPFPPTSLSDGVHDPAGGNHREKHWGGDADFGCAQVVVVPGSPVLIPSLGVGDDESARVLQLVYSVVSQCVAQARRVVIVGSANPRWFTKHTGSFRAWGAREVSDRGQGAQVMSAGNYLPELMARFFLGEAESQVDMVCEHIPQLQAGDCVLVVVDGSAGLTTKAPLSLLPHASACHEWCCSLLAHGAASIRMSEAELADAGVVEPTLWRELCQLSEQVRSARLIHADSSLGVGRYLSVWEVETTAE